MGINKMKALMAERNLPDPLFEDTASHFFVTFQKVGDAFDSSPQVKKLLDVLDGEMSRFELMKALGLKDRVYFLKSYLDPALNDFWVEITQPDSPNSPTQKYQLTENGKKFLK